MYMYIYIKTKHMYMYIYIKTKLIDGIKIGFTLNMTSVVSMLIHFSINTC